MPDPNTDLDAQYVAAEERISLLNLTDHTLKETLANWREEVLQQTDRPLSCPWTFANELGQLELEWESGSKFLTIRLLDKQRIEYLQGDSVSDIEEGSGDYEKALSLLVWINKP